MESHFDFSSVIKRSRDGADGMSKGIDYLLKKNKIEVIYGHGKIAKIIRLLLQKMIAKKNIQAKHIIIATGARSRELPNLKQDGKKIIGYREAMTLPSKPNKIVIVGFTQCRVCHL